MTGNALVQCRLLPTTVEPAMQLADIPSSQSAAMGRRLSWPEDTRSGWFGVGGGSRSHIADVRSVPDPTLVFRKLPMTKNSVSECRLVTFAKQAGYAFNGVCLFIC